DLSAGLRSVADLHHRLRLRGNAHDVRGTAFGTVRAQLFGELLCLTRELLDDVGLGNGADDLALDEDLTLLLAGRDTDVGFARLAGSVHHTPHDGNAHRNIDRGESLLDGGCEREHIDLRAPARRAGDQVEAALPQPERLEDPDSRLHFLHRIGGERYPDRVADAFGEQRPDAD